MKYAHLIKLSVFSYENEDKQLILDSAVAFFPFDLEENKIAISKTNATGFNEKRIGIVEIILAKNNLINQFLRNILSKLDENQIKTLSNQAESRLDENLDFFIRFDKDEWMNNRKLKLTDSGKCFHLKMSIAAFPKKKEIGLKVVRDLFSSQ